MTPIKVGLVVSIPEDEDIRGQVINSLDVLLAGDHRVDYQSIDLMANNIREKDPLSTSHDSQDFSNVDLLRIIRFVQKANVVVFVFKDGELMGSDPIFDILENIEFELADKPINFIAIHSHERVSKRVDQMRLQCIDLEGIPLARPIYFNPEENNEIPRIDCFFGEQTCLSIQVRMHRLRSLAHVLLGGVVL
jgi:hypothetical protein